MEIKIDIGYKQLLKLIKQLPASQVAKLKAELDETFIATKSEKEISDLQQFLIEGPVMSDDQYLFFKENRKKLNQ